MIVALIGLRTRLKPLNSGAVKEFFPGLFLREISHQNMNLLMSDHQCLIERLISCALP